MGGVVVVVVLVLLLGAVAAAAAAGAMLVGARHLGVRLEGALDDVLTENAVDCWGPAAEADDGAHCPVTQLVRRDVTHLARIVVNVRLGRGRREQGKGNGKKGNGLVDVLSGVGGGREKRGGGSINTAA